MSGVDPDAQSARRVIWQRVLIALAALAPLVAIAAQGPAVVPDWQTAQEVVIVAGLLVGAGAAVGSSVWLWMARTSWTVPVVGSLLLVGWAFLTFLVVAAMSFGEAMDGGRLLQTVPLDDGGMVFLFEDTGFLNDRPRTRVMHARRGDILMTRMGMARPNIQTVSRKGKGVELRSPRGTQWLALP
jgi:hypothetical protein